MAELRGDITIAPKGNIPINGVLGNGGGIMRSLGVNNTTTTYTQSVTANTFNAVTDISRNIATRSNTGVLIYARWSGELVELWNATWGLSRNGVNITNPIDAGGPDPGSRNPGVLVGGDSFASTSANNASTPAMVEFWWFDPSPIPDATNTYQLWVRPQANRTLYTNRTISDLDNNAHERMASSMVLMEVTRG